MNVQTRFSPESYKNSPIDQINNAIDTVMEDFRSWIARASYVQRAGAD